MALEASLSRAVIEKLSPLHAVRIESPMESGVPDINCTAGWIELKHLDAWPAREDTIVQPRHFKPEQRLWLKNRCEARGHAWLLLRVGSEWCLVWGVSAAEHLGVSWKRSDLAIPTGHGASPGYDRAHWPKPPSSTEFIRALVVRRWL